MLDGAELARDFARSGQLGIVALSVGDAERVTSLAVVARHRQCRGRIQTTGQEYDRLVVTRAHQRPGWSPHRNLCNWIWKRTGSLSSSTHCASFDGGSSS